MQKVQFEYFYNDDSEQYSFYRIPKLLFTEEYFSSLSCEAKVLYGLMLDRMEFILECLEEHMTMEDIKRITGPEMNVEKMRLLKRMIKNDYRKEA